MNLTIVRFVMASLLAMLALPSFAATTVTPGSWELRRGTTLLATFASEQACIENATARNVTQTYTCRTNTTVAVAAVVAPPPTCGAQPAALVRTATCPAGTTGTWVQTSTYASAPSPTCWTAGPWLPATAPAGTCVPTTPPGAVNFATTFETTEAQISEGGAWIKSPNLWRPVKTELGVAHASGFNAGYDDSYSLMAQPFGPDQTVEVVLEVGSAPFDRNQSHEILLMLRMGDDASNARGYECQFNFAGGWDILRWNGPMGSWSPINLTWSSYWGQDLKTGDVLKCSVVGNVITAYINNVMMLQGNDSLFTSGQPGLGFFVRPGGDLTHLKATSFKATSN